MDFVSNNISFRRVPHQSGEYEADISVTQNNHSSSLRFLFSGAGSIFFAFGSDSGNYYASGVKKLYLRQGVPSIPQNYAVVLDDDSYDIYGENNTAIVFGAPKATGILQRVYVQAESGVDGSFDFQLKGDIPSYTTSGNLIFPNQQQYQQSFAFINSGNVPFSVLSGSFTSLDYISGLSSFPLDVDVGQEVPLYFSGRLNSDVGVGSTVTLYTDFGTVTVNTTFSPTSISGSGHSFTTPAAPIVDYGALSNLDWSIKNTGTQIVTFYPLLDKISRDIPIGASLINGIPLRNMFSGFLDTTSQFFFSDKISFPSGEFFVVQESQTGMALLHRTGAFVTGWLLGTSTNSYVGQTFELPYNYQLTGITTWLYKGTGTAVGDEEAYIDIREGAGVTGSILATSTTAAISNLATGIENTSPFSFTFSTPFEIVSGVQYSVVMGGSTNLIYGSTDGVNINWLMETGGAQSSGFYVDLTGVVNTTGNMYMSIAWLKPTDCYRYQLNIISGVTNDFTYVSTGSYDKYMSEKSFVINPQLMTSIPNETSSFTFFYTGVVSGLNMGRLRFSGTSYDETISGFTV